MEQLDAALVSETTRAHALLIEDEDDMAAYVADGLSQVGWSVDRADDGAAGLTLARQQDFDLLIVDRLLPGLDGLSLVTELRTQDVLTPILFLTAMGSVTDRVTGLARGGDDYLVKPFALAELLARANALLRRRPAREPEATTLSAGGLTLDRLLRRVKRGNDEIELLPLEYRLLEFLMLNAGHIVTRKMLLEKVWGFQFDPRTNIVETHISHLRSKIQRRGEPSLITTVRGAGYVIGAPDTVPAG